MTKNQRAGLVEDSLTLDIDQWINDGAPTSGGSIEWQNLIREVLAAIRLELQRLEGELAYRVTWSDGNEQTIRLTNYEPPMGGVRWLFICAGCGDRFRKLYAPKAGQEFRCRDCHNLVYASSRESSRYRSELRKLTLPQLQERINSADVQELTHIVDLINQEVLAVYKKDKPWPEVVSELRSRGH